MLKQLTTIFIGRQKKSRIFTPHKLQRLWLFLSGKLSAIDWFLRCFKQQLIKRSGDIGFVVEVDTENLGSCLIVDNDVAHNTRLAGLSLDQLDSISKRVSKFKPLEAGNGLPV